MDDIYVIQVTALVSNRYFNIGGSIYKDETEWNNAWNKIPVSCNMDFKTLKTQAEMVILVDKMQSSGTIKDSKIIDEAIAKQLLAVDNIQAIFDLAKKDRKYSIGNTRERNKIFDLNK